MNVVDLVIIGVVVLLGLMGLRSGLLKPISGIGGLIIGVMLAVQHSAEVATMLEDYIEGDLARQVAAFGGIVIVSAAVARLAAWIVKKILKTLVLGWVDHVAGALGGAALGLVLAGTGTYLLTGADLEPTREALAASKLAPEVSRVTVLSSSQPWCSQIEGGDAEGADCTNISGLFNDYFGERIAAQVSNFLGEDAGTLAEVVQSTLSGSPADISGLLNSEAASGDSSSLVDAIGGSFGGKSAEEIANMVSSSGAIAGSFPDKSPEEIANLVKSLTSEGGALEGKSPEEIADLAKSGALPQIPQEIIDALNSKTSPAQEPQPAQTP